MKLSFRALTAIRGHLKQAGLDLEPCYKEVESALAASGTDDALADECDTAADALGLFSRSESHRQEADLLRREAARLRRTDDALADECDEARNALGTFWRPGDNEGPKPEATLHKVADALEHAAARLRRQPTREQIAALERQADGLEEMWAALGREDCRDDARLIRELLALFRAPTREQIRRAIIHFEGDPDGAAEEIEMLFRAPSEVCATCGEPLCKAADVPPYCPNKHRQAVPSEDELPPKRPQHEPPERRYVTGTMDWEPGPSASSEAKPT